MIASLGMKVLDNLVWAPESEQTNSSEWECSPALELCGGCYEVTHYDKKALGRAFGPMQLNHIVRFCFTLGARLDNGGSVMLTTPPGDTQMRANGAVLLGAYLVLNLRWSLDEIKMKLGERDGRLHFVCSWARPDRPEPPPVMSVQDCWMAFREALRNEWLGQTCVKCESSMLGVCTELKSFTSVYDAAWLVPGRILVCADPVTTALDPNPVTFKDIFPKDDGGSQRRKESLGADPYSPTAHSAKDIDPMSPTSPSAAEVNAYEPSTPASSLAGVSVDTLNKEYREAFLRDSTREVFGFGDSAQPMDFVSFLKKCGVKLLIRTNFVHEPGLKKSYDPKTFMSHGFTFLDLPVPDEKGGIPSKAIIDRVIGACEPFLHQDMEAVMVHCKGGFGRSVVLACCVAARRFDVPGPALLAWARMVRPGAVNTPQQENFVRSLLPGGGLHEDTPPACCSMQ